METLKTKLTERKFLIPVIAWLVVLVKNATGIDLGDEFAPYLAEGVATLFTVIFMVAETINDNKKITVAASKVPDSRSSNNQTSAGDEVEQPKGTNGSPEQPQEKQYAIPFDVTQVRLNTDPFLSYEQFEDYFYSLDLRAFNPEIAFEFANQVVGEGFRRAGIAWKDLFRKAGATVDVRVPVAADFQVSKTTGKMLDQLTEAAEQEFNGFIPSECSRLAYNVHNVYQMVIAFYTLYSIQNVFKLLEGKTINWNKVATIMDIYRLSLGAV